MMSEFDGPDFVVIRPAPGLPPGFFPPELDGKWFDRESFPTRVGPPVEHAVTPVPTGRFEYRDDGAVAEVYEVRADG